MARRILGLSIGVVTFAFMALLPMTSRAGTVDVTVGSTPVGEPTRFYVIRGADAIIYYTLEQLDAVPETGAGAFVPASSCPANPFTLDTDVNSNRFPDSNAGATPFRPLPGGRRAASGPDVSKITTGPGLAPNTGILIVVGGGDGETYRTMFDPNCDGTYAIFTFGCVACGFGDPERDGWPGQTTTSVPWVRIAP